MRVREPSVRAFVGAAADADAATVMGLLRERKNGFKRS
jgi:hypothetical protein